MEDLSNADGPKTSRSMGQEASAERANFRTHSPEQECEPLSEQDLQERGKRLENQIEILKKMLKHEKEEKRENNREFQNKIEDLQESLETSKKKVLELNKALDAQKNVYKQQTSKAQEAIYRCRKLHDDTKKEYDDLKERFDVLNDLYIATLQQQVEDGIKRINVREDEVDGSEEETALTISDDILPLVRKALNPSFYWNNPFKCPAACVMSATHFVLSEDWKNRLCEHKFAREVQKLTDEVNNAIQQITEVPTVNEKIKCSDAVQDLNNIGLLKLEILSGDFHDDQLCEAIEPLEIREKALIVIFRDRGLDHCMTIYKCADQSKPNARVEIFDVQSGKLWPRSAEDTSNVKKFQIFRIEESKKQHFREKCSISLCRNERKCACLLLAQQSNSDL